MLDATPPFVLAKIACSPCSMLVVRLLDEEEVVSFCCSCLCWWFCRSRLHRAIYFGDAGTIEERCVNQPGSACCCG